MGLHQLQCVNCGAPLECDGTYGKPVKCPYCGTTFIPAATEMEDVWLMTDPVARARYEFNGTLDKLEHDIRYEVMRGQDWSPSDRAFVQQASELEKSGVIRKLASFWAISPHPPIYRALQEGQLELDGRRIPFHKGDEIVWACPMTRDRFNLDVPVLIGDFDNERVQHLCSEMLNAMQGRMRE